MQPSQHHRLLLRLAELAIALITILALTVSASLTPATPPQYRAAGGISTLADRGLFVFAWCGAGSMRGTTTPFPAAGGRPAIETKRQACEAKCVNAKEAAGRQSRQRLQID
jgi:hypothetical protein